MPVQLTIDDYDLPAFLRTAANFGTASFGYVVTPNVDHLVRFHDDASFRDAYADASYVLLDSRVLATLLRLARGITARVCTGSDLTMALFRQVISPDDSIVLVGGSAEQAEKVASTFQLRRLRHMNPPMGFIHDGQATEECLRFIEEATPFRFCFLAVGAPQQERIAQALARRGRARGLALCVGASINFLTGAEQRAPEWMQRAALEWLYRLLRDPGRLAHRYLIRGPRVFGLLRSTDVVLRGQPA